MKKTLGTFERDYAPAGPPKKLSLITSSSPTKSMLTLSENLLPDSSPYNIDCGWRAFLGQRMSLLKGKWNCTLVIAQVNKRPEKISLLDYLRKQQKQKKKKKEKKTTTTITTSKQLVLQCAHITIIELLDTSLTDHL